MGSERCVRDSVNLGAKRRTAITRLTATGSHASKHRELVCDLTRASEVAKKKKVPLRGRQPFS